MADPAEAAARRAYGPDWDLTDLTTIIAEALRVDADDPADDWVQGVWRHRAEVALAAIREALAEKYAASPYGNPCLDVLAELAPLIYPSTELEEGSTS